MNMQSHELALESPASAPCPHRLDRSMSQRLLGKRRPGVFLPALASAVPLWLSYFPAHCGWLGWVALVPFLSLVRSPAASWRIYLAGWLGPLAFFFASLQWLRVADWRMNFTWIGLALFCSLFFLLGLWLLRVLDRWSRLPLVLSVPIVWTALEYFRAHALTGFPWYFLSHTQHAFLPVIQIADLGGAYLVTFVVAAVNALVFELLTAPRRRPLLPQVVGVVLVLAGVLGYGYWRLDQHDFASGPRIALLQGNVDQRIRNAAVEQEQAASDMVRHYRDLSDVAAAGTPPPNLIVWPETSFPHDWIEIAPGMSPSKRPADWQNGESLSRRMTRIIAQRSHTNVLLGLNCDVLAADGKPERYNSAVLVTPDGEKVDRYDKMHCVPFGEYVPLRDIFPWMNAFAPYDFDYSVKTGERFTRFLLGPYHFGVVICYEDTDPYLARQYVRTDGGEPAVDFLVNISNDGWFNGTSEHEEHLAICRFRAVECRRAVVRAVNMGISAVIDGNGQVVALPGPTWADSKKVASVVSATVPLDGRTSLYARWGDWLPWSCWTIIGLVFVVRLVRPANRRGQPSC
jgi:apolipoprotein N-acyltransferase